MYGTDDRLEPYQETDPTWKDLAMKKRDYTRSSQMMAGNEQIAAEVAKNANGIGYVGLAYIHASGTKVVAVDDVAVRLPVDGVIAMQHEHHRVRAVTGNRCVGSSLLGWVKQRGT